MVVVNLYAFEKTAAQPGVAFGHLIENIDIGGPSMVRSAAKNFEDVAIVTRVADYPALIEELKANGGALEPRNSLAAGQAGLRAHRCLRHSHRQHARPDCRSSRAHQRPPRRTQPACPRPCASTSRWRSLCATAKIPTSAPRSTPTAQGWASPAHTQLQGKELSFNNIVDLDACWELAQEFDEPAVIIVKHTNPCGAATGSTILEAYLKALACDPVSAYGGVIGINRAVDGDAAEEIAKLFVEAIAAPGFTAEARERFAAKKNLRLVEVHAAPPRPVVKHVSGGLIAAGRRHRPHQRRRARSRPEGRHLASAHRRGAAQPALRLARLQARQVERHRLCRVDGQTLGVGAGQMSRVDAARFGAMKAVLPLKGCVAASDAFFPFPDGLEAVAAAGATAVIQPGGSVRDEEVIAAADKLGMAMVFTGMRHFRH